MTRGQILPSVLQASESLQSLMRAEQHASSSAKKATWRASWQRRKNRGNTKPRKLERRKQVLSAACAMGKHKRCHSLNCPCPCGHLVVDNAS